MPLKAISNFPLIVDRRRGTSNNQAPLAAHFLASFSESKKMVCLLQGSASSMCRDSRSLAAFLSSADLCVDTYPRSWVFNSCQKPPHLC